MTTKQKDTEWKPKPAQRRVLEAAQQAGLDRTITAVCEEAKIGRPAFYRWLKKDPGFAAAWDEIWHRSITRHMPGIVAATIAKAKKGNVPAARLIADMAGVLKVKHEHSGDGANPLEIIVRHVEDDTTD